MGPFLGADGVTFRDYAVVFGVSLVASVVLTWVVRGIMRRFGILDRPDESGRKAHRAPVAYEGGVAIFLAWLAGLLTAAWVYPLWVFEMPQTVGLLIGATLTVALGVADDLLDLRAWVKLLGQLGIGALMFWFGFGIERVGNPLGAQLILPVAVSFIGTVLWYAILMNGINMVDGLDGLAAGITAISAAVLVAMALEIDQSWNAMLALIVVGVAVGFLKFNFSPASIFMGDAGSLLLGFLLASITLRSSTRAPALLALVIPVMTVGLPLFEAVFALFRRMMKGQHPFAADRRHLHHRLLALGFTERRTVLIFYYLTAYLGVTALVLQRLETRSTLALVVLVMVGLFILLESLRFLEKRSGEQEGPGGPGAAPPPAASG